MAPKKAPTVPKAPSAVPTTKTGEIFESSFNEDNEPEFGVLQERTTPPVEPAVPPTAQTPVETVEMPNTILVQHNVTKKQFRVSKRYFETYSSVLTRVD